MKQSIISFIQKFCTFWHLKRLGGGAMMAPLDISRDYSATRDGLAATLYDNFLLSFPHILTPNLWQPGARFRMHVGPKMAPKCDFVYKINANLFFHLVHINMLMFTLNCWNYLVFDLLCFKKCLPQILVKTTTKTKGQKNKEIHKKFTKR